MTPHVFVDAAALRAAPDQFDASAQTIDQLVRGRLGRLRFSGAVAGRADQVAGDALRRTLDTWAAELAQWSRASAEIAAALRLGAQSYTEAELAAAARVG